MFFAAPLPNETHIVKHQKQYIEINGKPVEDLHVTEYNDNGNIVVKGQYNNKPFFYANKQEFRNKPDTFLNSSNDVPVFSREPPLTILLKSPSSNRISRTLTPFRRKTHKLRNKLNQINRNRNRKRNKKSAKRHTRKK